jgi:hypothetical protein
MPAATWAMAALSFVLAFLARPLRGASRDADVRGYFHGRRHSLCAHLCTPPKLGKSHWWLGIWLIPFVGFYVTVLCLAAPPGYAQHRQMDTAGGAIVAALAALVTIVIALAVFG